MFSHWQNYCDCFYILKWWISPVNSFDKTNKIPVYKRKKPYFVKAFLHPSLLLPIINSKKKHYCYIKLKVSKRCLSKEADVKTHFGLHLPLAYIEMCNLTQNIFRNLTYTIAYLWSKEKLGWVWHSSLLCTIVEICLPHILKTVPSQNKPFLFTSTLKWQQIKAL